MLTEEESKELKKLSPVLRDKIENIFKSPVFYAWRAVRSQINEICKELIDSPKPIEEDIDYEKFKDYDNADKIIQAISSTSRGKSETALKWMKEMEELVKTERSLWAQLTQEEKKEATFLTTSDLRKEALA